MKISEILENYNQSRHSLEASIFQENIISIDIRRKKILEKYVNREISKNEAIQLLEIIVSFVQELMYSSEYFDFLMHTLPNHFESLAKDWIDLENNIQQSIHQITNRK